MAIGTYSELKTALANWLNRSDLTDRIPEFIAMAEAGFNRVLRVRDQVVRTRSDILGQFATLPADFLEGINIQVNDTIPYTIPVLSSSQADKLRTALGDVPGKALGAAVVGSQLELIPTPSSALTIELAYYKKITALSDAATTNWLLTKSPDLYLYGSLIHSAPYLHDDERVNLWTAAHDRMIADMRAESAASTYIGPVSMGFRAFG